MKIPIYRMSFIATKAPSWDWPLYAYSFEVIEDLPPDPEDPDSPGTVGTGSKPCGWLKVPDGARLERDPYEDEDEDEDGEEHYIPPEEVSDLKLRLPNGQLISPIVAMEFFGWPDPTAAEASQAVIMQITKRGAQDPGVN